MALTAVIAAAPLASAATYHFSAAGNDATGNGSLAKPWQSVAKFNQLNLSPGDNVLFRAGDTFSGRMWLDESDSGTSAAGHLISPVKIGSYGAVGATTRATIVSPYNNEGFVAYNAGGIELSDLEFVSGGFNGNSRTNGVQFMSDKVGSSFLSQYEHVRVNNVASRGFGLNGLQVWAHHSVGFDDVHVADSEFSGNGYAGVYVGASQWQNKYHADVVVERVVAHNNPGYVGELPITGHGVILANVDGGTIQDSVAYDNGKVNGNANVGLWTYQSNAVTIQRNVAYGNRSPGGFDGGAYDIDGGVTNSVIQYNQSFDNDGAGLLLAEYQSTNAMAKNVFRYNLSVNDGRDGYGGISITGAGSAMIAKNAIFHNNTVIVDKNVVPNAKGAVWFINAQHADLDFINNSFVALNGAALIAGDTTVAKATFARNSYWTDGGPIILESAVYPSVLAWASQNVQERINNVYVAVTSDPQFLDEETFRPSPTSPLVDAARTPGGVPWPTWVANLGLRDLAGAPLYQSDGPDIGAWEYVPSLPGDFNGDGAVDGGDLTVWQGEFSSVEATAAGGGAGSADFDGDGDVDGADFLHWQRSVGLGSAITTSAAAVPEPSVALLAVFATAFVASRRRLRPPGANR